MIVGQYFLVSGGEEWMRGRRWEGDDKEMGLINVKLNAEKFMGETEILEEESD